MATFKTSDGVNLNYHDQGGALKPAIILLTGYSSSEMTWHYQVEPLLAAGWRVITYDHRNHGASDQVTYGLTAARLATDLAELMAYLDVENAVLMGHSMGAMVAMTYETLYTDANLRAVVTVDQAPTILRKADWLAGEVGLNWDEVPTFMDRLPSMHLMAQPLPADMKAELGRLTLPFDFKANRGMLLDTVMQDWRATLQRERVPHFFAVGGRSPLYPAVVGDASYELQQNELSKKVLFPAAGHIPHLEAVDEFNQELLSFLETVLNN